MRALSRRRLLLSSLSVAVCAGEDSTRYHPATPINGAIRIWGSAQASELVERWESGFRRFHPLATIENRLFGAVSAIAGLYTGVADLAVSREIWPVETLAFEQVLGYKPTAFDVATGSFDVPTKSSALHILVHRDNPLQQVTFPQLARVFAANPAGPAAWGDLGLSGDWRKRPIQPYGYRFDNAGAMLFASLVFAGNPLWTNVYHGFENNYLPDGHRIDAGQTVVNALARDPQGIALANLHYADSQIRAVAVARNDSGPFVLPTRKTVADRTYPLTRQVYLFVARKPGARMESFCYEFVRYVLSREGQTDVSGEGAYLPLPPDLAAAGLRNLGNNE